MALKAGMGNSQIEAKRAVEAGYWHLYRYNPALKEEGKNPFILDSKEPTASFRDFINGRSKIFIPYKNLPGKSGKAFRAG
jgi:pyruvate-ferredoxin/flavodoxin oxidoreductase